MLAALVSRLVVPEFGLSKTTQPRPEAKTPASQVLVGITRQGLRTHANAFAPK